ncbi:TetR family transcriptional regulator [Streptomyces carminius]|uniref:TetR family transcriptional regulator n=1 Tax=Streptomyces carminius TaxID=2665496 RepID=A0A2M8MBX3_9ACTN|nr:TetR/AcrR family transcriptional regulator [Streptomyces carminius]PJE97866.1 TetR family transcriptional regulator [Streptomyces carminius]PJF01693.1 TetR family transcriptional regulator [Streptomyces carminius]
MAPRTARPPARTELIADTAIGLLAERGLRGLTHRAVDEAAGLPQGSTSNHARTREALLELTVRRLAVREASVLEPRRTPVPGGSGDPAGALAEALARTLHRYLTHHRHLTVARYELALEATRRPALRAVYDRTGGNAFREPLVAMMTAAGSAEPERHALSLIAWCDGMMFSCTAGSYHSTVPALEELRAGLGELLAGMLRR